MFIDTDHSASRAFEFGRMSKERINGEETMQCAPNDVCQSNTSAGEIDCAGPPLQITYLVGART